MRDRERAEKMAAEEAAKRRSRFKGEDEWIVQRRRRRNCLVAVLFMSLIFISLWQNKIILYSPQ